jgi:hypothetical protein
MSLNAARQFGRVFLAVACAGGMLQEASAQPAEAGLPLYVSDQFKALARRAFREVVTQEVARACPPDKPLCGPVAARLAEAVDAALRNDGRALRAALDGLFLDASAGGMLQGSMSGLLAVKEHEIGTAVAPVAACISAALTDKPTRSACAAAPGPGGPLEKLQALRKQFTFEGNDKEVVKAFLASLKSTRRVDPELAIRALAALAATEAVHRYDIAIYLRRLAVFYAAGFDEGLSGATYRFLTADPDKVSANADRAERFVLGLLADYRPGGTLTILFQDDYLKNLVGHAAACGLEAKPLADWTARRAEFVADLRQAILSGGPPDFGPLDGLLSLDPARCTGEEAAAAVRALHRHVRYFRAPLAFHSATERYGAPALAIAGILDFVRDRDEARLDRNMARALVYAVAQLALRQDLLRRLRAESAGGAPVAAGDLLRIGDALTSCEVGLLASALDVKVGSPRRSRDVPAGQCYSVVTQKNEPTMTLPQREGRPLAEWLRANYGAVARKLTPLVDKLAATAEQRGYLDEAHVDAISRASAFLADGDLVGARKTVIRVGVDLLVDKLDGITSDLVGGAEQVCTEEFQTTSIFTRVGAGCTVHLLVLGAYRPIADYYWATGAAAGGDASQLSAAVYRGLLSSPALDHTPLILNLGLGATYVRGKQEIWGRNGYMALTVLDKIGVAFYKRSTPKSQFEVGAYAGGFLDALIRTAAGAGKEQRTWQAGLTAGWPRVRYLPVGFELHAGAAMPFELGARSRYGFAAGASVVVPMSWVLETKGE